jgi:hypothetical protein
MIYPPRPQPARTRAAVLVPRVRPCRQTATQGAYTQRAGLPGGGLRFVARPPWHPPGKEV